jgi:pimeloyl-ACP methyl ester carboxylesterase
LAPEILKSVIFARFGVEQVDDHGAIVEQDPAALAVAFDAHPVVFKFAFQDPVDFLADGVELPAAVARYEHKIVELGGHRPHVEHGDVFAAVIFGRTGSGERELFAAFLTFFERGRCVCDGDPLAR